MEWELLEKILRQAICNLFRRDGYLLRVGANEPTIGGKLAWYINAAIIQERKKNISTYSQLRVPKYSVDVEYKDDTDNGKKKIAIRKNFSFRPDDPDEVRPDIILHRRGNNRNNLLAIELKKQNQYLKFTEEIQAKRKAIGYVGQERLGYKFGLYLAFRTNTDDFGISEAKLIRQDSFTQLHTSAILTRLAKMEELWVRVNESLSPEQKVRETEILNEIEQEWGFEDVTQFLQPTPEDWQKSRSSKIS